EHEREGAVRMLRAQLRHRALQIAGDDQMPDLTPFFECALEERNSFRTLPGARERDPEVFASSAMEVIKLGQQRGAGQRPHVTSEPAAQKRGERPSSVVRRTRA